MQNGNVYDEMFLRAFEDFDAFSDNSSLSKKLIMNVIYPKLLYSIQEYIPSISRDIQVHSWIIPWLPHFHKYTTPIEYKNLLVCARRKLRTILSSYHTTIEDLKECYNLIVPWKEILNKYLLEIVKDVLVPRLARVLRKMEIHIEQN